MWSPGTRSTHLNEPVPIGRVLKRRGVGIGLLAQDVLGHDEGPGQDRRIGRVGLLQPPGELGRRDHLDVAHELVAGAAAGAEVRVVDQLDRELDVLGGERRAVMPLDAVLELEAPVEAVGRDAAILDGRDLGDEIGDQVAVGTGPPERAEQVEVDALVDLDVQHQGIEDRGLLREADHRLAGGLGRRRRGLGPRHPAQLRARAMPWRRRAAPVAISRDAWSVASCCLRGVSHRGSPCLLPGLPASAGAPWPRRAGNAVKHGPWAWPASRRGSATSRNGGRVDDRIAAHDQIGHQPPGARADAEAVAGEAGGDEEARHGCRPARSPARRPA